MTRRWLLLGAMAVVLGSLASAYAATSLNGAGASFPYPLYSKWVAVYHQKTGVQVNYQSVGSGAGIQQLKARTVDFAGSDAPLTDAEQKGMPGKVLHIPTCFGAVALAFNLKFNRLYMNQELLEGIFLGKVTRWNDPRIAAINKGITLPNLPITVCHRSDGSGTTYIFTDYLSHVSKTWRSQVGCGKSVKWPVGIGGKGNEGVAGLIKQNPGAIGYVELNYALKNGLPMFNLRNKSGYYIAPSLDSTAAAAEGVSEQMRRDVRVSLVDAEGDDAYPIVGATYLMVYQTQAKGEKATELVRYLKWCITSGQSYCKGLLYAPLPAAVVNINSRAINTIVQQ